MRRLFMPWAAVVTLLGLLAAPAHAAPLSGIEAASALTDKSAVQRTHGWHRFCSWGPRRYHRHVPGVGNIRCRPYYRSEYYYGYGGGYVAPYYYGRRVRRHVYRPRVVQQYGRYGGGGRTHIYRPGRVQQYGGFGGGPRGGGGRIQGGGMRGGGGFGGGGFGGGGRRR